jgi:hypothetical protein
MDNENVPSACPPVRLSAYPPVRLSACPPVPRDLAHHTAHTLPTDSAEPTSYIEAPVRNVRSAVPGNRRGIVWNHEYSLTHRPIASGRE